MPSLPVASSNVLGRFTGKRSVKETTRDPAAQITALPDKSKISNGHRRESSVLSLSSVTELGQNVKRSVSLRSHRSHPSESSSSLGLRSKSPFSSTPYNPTLAAPTIEDEEPHTARQESSHPPETRGKLSASARSLSSKLSSPSLQTYNHLGSLDSAVDRPATAVDIRRTATSPAPMIAGGSLLAAGASSRRGIPDSELPPLPSSFSTHSSETATTSGQAVHNERLYMQSTATPVPYHASTHDPKAVYKTIHETASKRMATIEYLRKVHEGNVFYFSTLQYSPVHLQSLPSMHPNKLPKRASNYFVLGYSLPALLDLNSGSPLEYLRALASLLQEFETYQNLMGMDSSGNSLSKGRVQNMFKLGSRAPKGRRSSSVQDNITGMGQELLGLPHAGGGGNISPMESSSPISPTGYDFNRLVTPHLPFDLDFTTIYATLCDTMVDTYAKLIDLVSSPDVCSPAVGDWFSKVDKMLQKTLLSSVIRELEESTKSTAKSEVAGLGKLVFGGLM